MLHPHSSNSPVSEDELEQMIATAVEASSRQIAESLAGRIAVEVQSRLTVARAGNEPIDATPIEMLPLSSRVRTSLRRAEVRTFGDLCRLSEQELLGWRSFGVRSVAEVRRLLAWDGRHLREMRAESGE
jgi:DNA-directed RNA polymerase alpha subunit